MALASGIRLGPYEIVARAGAGGMGEVYRAHDSRLNRDVAIKVLPDHLAANAELRERFEREARAISQLSHPHICVLYDIGKHEGADYLVLEYLEGETLGARLRRGLLPTDQVLKYGAQIADALDKAHRLGVVHRDLKPDNVMVTKTGLKLLDFGLAKPLAAPGNVSSSIAATMTNSPLTAEGTLVGTFQYMAPEQLEGREADKRSDLFAFGCVLYEMATGKRAFEGKSTASVIASIMHTDPPPVAENAPLTPPALEWAIRRCLAKDPDERWQNAGDLAGELRWIQESGSRTGVAVPVAVRTRRKALRWAVLALALFAGCFAGWFLKRAPDTPVLRVALNLPPGTSLVAENAVALSPDGQWVAMTLADPQGKTKIWVRRLSSDIALPLDGTEGSITPFWSPDSRFIAFFALDGKLRKIPLGGGQAEAVCDLWQVYGGAWGHDDVIVFATGRKGLFQVSAAGGTPVRIPTPENESSDFRLPQFLPDGKHLLVTANSSGGIFVVDRITGKVQPVLPDESLALYAEPGYLLFLHGSSLMAQPFDAGSLRLTETAHPIAESVFVSPMSFSTSPGGLMVYQKAFQTQLTWLDPSGNKLSKVGGPDHISNPYLSPDGRYAAYSVADLRQGKQKLWLYDLSAGTSAPFTFGEGNDQYPAWSPDSRQIAFSSTRHGKEEIYVKAIAGGSDDQLLLSVDGSAEPDRFSPDGRFLLFDYVTKTNGTDVWALPLFGDRKPFAVISSPANENWGIFSPDGKWVAYSSDESGRAEVYVARFPNGAAKRQVSTGGGVTSFWPQGKELFYLEPDWHMNGVEMNMAAENLTLGKTRQLFGGRLLGNTTGIFVAPDSKRWLAAFAVDEGNASPLILTTNWRAALKP
jgi:Tol biopolymer transport system component